MVEKEKKAAAQSGEQEAFLAEIQERSKDILRRLPALGPILVLYLQSQHRRYQFICDIEWLVLPPLVRNQCKLYMKKEYPFSFVSWAFVNEEVEKRLIANGGKLREEDWNCGDRVCLIDILAPFGGVEAMLKDIQKNVFPDRGIHLLAPDLKTGGITVRELTTDANKETKDNKTQVH
ncbi:MAG: toxin-activating lysine-acyltransferase [Deltaproteobacteria bacterium]|nr:MAG: toxin-activating lysine-acyltransferase [Deltaproteobacteria bacterium]